MSPETILKEIAQVARIAGVNIPNQKRVPIGLTYIHGIGRTKARQICEQARHPAGAAGA